MVEHVPLRLCELSLDEVEGQREKEAQSDFSFQGHLAEHGDIFHCHKEGCSWCLVCRGKGCSSTPVMVIITVELDGVQNHHGNTSGCIYEGIFRKERENPAPDVGAPPQSWAQ